MVCFTSCQRSATPQRCTRRNSLDGIDDYVQFSQKLIPTSGSFSVAFFAQQISRQTSYVEVISQGFSDASAAGFYVGHDPSHNIRIGDQVQNTGLPFPSDGLFHHYAVTADTNSTRLYIDGCLIRAFHPIKVAVGGTDTRLGRQFGVITEFFHGNVDEVWIFSGTLTVSEVAALAGTYCLPVSIRVSEVEVCWPSLTDKQYRVDYLSTLTTNTWLPLFTNITGTGEEMCVYDRILRGRPQRHYRVVDTSE